MKMRFGLMAITVAFVCTTVTSCGDSSRDKHAASEVCQLPEDLACSCTDGSFGQWSCTDDGGANCRCDVETCGARDQEICRDGFLMREDACGNVNSTDAVGCMCSCAEDGKHCGDYEDPFDTVVLGCEDKSACVTASATCSGDETEAYLDIRTTVDCDVPVRCIMRHTVADYDGPVEAVSYKSNNCIQPLGASTSNETVIGHRFASLAACEQHKDTFIINQVWRCVPEDAPANCLPANCDAAAIACAQ